MTGKAMDGLTTDHKGQIALWKVVLAAFHKGACVSLPCVPARYDLILDYQGKLYRAQVKYADCKAPHSQGAVQVDLRRRKRCYTRDEIDVLLVYIPQVDRVCWFPPEMFDNKAVLYLRWQPAKNGQTRGCRAIEDFLW
jgi:hypothetical protein